MELPEPDVYPMWSEIIGRHGYMPVVCEQSNCRFIPREEYSQDIKDYPRVHIGQLRKPFL